jgi:hypothetical protein
MLARAAGRPVAAASLLASLAIIVTQGWPAGRASREAASGVALVLPSPA